MSNSSIFSDILGRQSWGHRETILGKQASTYGELLADAESLGNSLCSAGVSKGTLVGICLPNSREHVISLLAIYRVGAVSVLLNPQATADEKQYIRQNSGMLYIITQDSTNVINDIEEKLAERIWNDLRIIGPLPQRLPGIGDDGDCMIIYTSGSTNRQKGVILTKSSISSNVKSVSNYLALSPGDRTIIFTPPAYAYAVSQIFTHLWIGSAFLPWSPGLMYPGEILHAVKKYQLTGLAANPTSFRILNAIQNPGLDSLPSVRYVMSGGQPLDSRLARGLVKRFQMARILNMYGCTENSPRISSYFLPPEIPPGDRSWPVGQPISGTSIQIVDEFGIEVPKGGVGQILVQGTSLMRCYWREACLTQERLPNGWLRTGDFGFIDPEGNLNLVGRTDNIINVGHEKVAPEETEAIIGAIDGVVEVGVTSISDFLLGNVPVALLVINAEEAYILAQVRSECIAKLSSPKIPRKYVVVDSLPKTLYGKIDRRKLRELALQLGVSVEAPHQRRYNGAN